MFLKNNYILGQELAAKMNIRYSNISQLVSYLRRNQDFTTVKYGKCTFIDKTSDIMPNNIKYGLLSNEFTDLTNKMPFSYALSVFELTRFQLNKLIDKSVPNDIIVSTSTIENILFVEFSQEFVDLCNNNVVNILLEEDTFECYNLGYIDKYLKLGEKYITWYKK